MTCEYNRDEICPSDETNCRIFMWDEIENCPESVVECGKTTDAQPKEDQDDGRN